MKKRLVFFTILVLVMTITINVKAGEYWDVYSTIEKGESSRELYNSMPTPVKRGKVITVKLLVKKTKGWNISNGISRISWDKNAFELVETDAKYYKKGENVDNFYFGINRDNTLDVYYEMVSDYTPSSNTETIVELKFKVKDNAKDGIYQIHQFWRNEGVSLLVNDAIKNQYADDRILQYQIGNTKLISNFTKDNIENSSYIIGNHMFTRAGSDVYDGVLTTEYIMLASKSIQSDNKKDMIIYAKNARGNWINAITNEEITPPNEFKIENINMVANYLENGTYSDSNYGTILRLIQINDKEAIVTIENNNERIHGIASISNKVVMLKASGKTYKINISDNEVNIETTDSYLTSKKLQKRTNLSIDDYFNDAFALRSDSIEPSIYLKSVHTGKYTSSKYELYLLRNSDDSARICIREKGKEECLIDSNVFSNEKGYFFNGEETTYAISDLDELQYGLDYSENAFEIKCLGNCMNNPYKGKYTKQSSLTMEDAFHVWEKNEVEYRVEYDPNNGDEISYFYIPAGKSMVEVDAWLYEPYKEDHVFVEWQLNGKAYDYNTKVTKPITLKAVFVSYPAKPTLFEHNDTASYSSGYYITNVSINSSKYVVDGKQTIDGYELYTKSAGITRYLEKVNGQDAKETPANLTRLIAAPVGRYTVFVARAFKIVNGNRIYSEYSNELKFDLTTVKTPELQCDKKTGTQYECYLNNLSDYVIGHSVINNVSVTNYLPTTYTLLELKNGTYTSMNIGYKNIEKKFTITLEEGATRTLVAQAKLSTSSYSIDSSYSNKVVLKKPVVFTGVYSLDDKIIKLYNISEEKVAYDLTNTSLKLRGSVEDDNNEIFFNNNSATYTITKNGNNINLTVTGSSTYASGEYERVGNYTMTEYFEENFIADSSNLSDKKYNVIATAKIATNNNTMTMYMYKNVSNEVTIVFKWESGARLIRTFTINTDGSLSAWWDSGQTKEQIHIGFNQANTKFTVTEYNDDGTIDNESLYAGTYTFVEVATMEKLISNLESILY